MADLKIAFLVKILETVLKSISPDLKTFIKDKIQELDTKSKATKNPFDDLLVLLLKIIFE